MEAVTHVHLFIFFSYIVSPFYTVFIFPHAGSRRAMVQPMILVSFNPWEGVEKKE